MRTSAPDTLTALTAQVALSRARRDGRDEVEALHREGLLATPARIKEAKLEALRSLEVSLLTRAPREYLRKIRKTGDYTPDDMYRALMMYVDEYLQAYMKELL